MSTFYDLDFNYPIKVEVKVDVPGYPVNNISHNIEGYFDSVEHILQCVKDNITREFTGNEDMDKDEFVEELMSGKHNLEAPKKENYNAMRDIWCFEMFITQSTAFYRKAKCNKLPDIRDLKGDDIRQLTLPYVMYTGYNIIYNSKNDYEVLRYESMLVGDRLSKFIRRERQDYFKDAGKKFKYGDVVLDTYHPNNIEQYIMKQPMFVIWDWCNLYTTKNKNGFIYKIHQNDLKLMHKVTHSMADYIRDIISNNMLQYIDEEERISWC